MDAQRSNTEGVTGVKKTQKVRRVWSRVEEDALIVALKELVVSGWRADNAFKTGYLQNLEANLAVAFPGGKLVVRHIVSKLTVWKKTYYQLSEMLAMSGFGWNPTLKTIEVEGDDVWNNYVKVHRNVEHFRYKSFPFYEDWLIIFGKDRANGEMAQGFADAVQEDPQPPVVIVEDSRNDYVNLGSDGSDSGNEKMHGKTSGKLKEEKKLKKFVVGRKRKEPETIRVDPYPAYMDRFLEATNASLASLTNQLQSETKTVVSTTKQVYDAVGNLGVMSDRSRLFVITKITDNASHTELFLSMAEGDQAMFVEMMLEGLMPPSTK